MKKLPGMQGQMKNMKFVDKITLNIKSGDYIDSVHPRY